MFELVHKAKISKSLAIHHHITDCTGSMHCTALCTNLLNSGCRVLKGIILIKFVVNSSFLVGKETNWTSHFVRVGVQGLKSPFHLHSIITGSMHCTELCTNLLYSGCRVVETCSQFFFGKEGDKLDKCV